MGRPATIWGGVLFHIAESKNLAIFQSTNLKNDSNSKKKVYLFAKVLTKFCDVLKIFKGFYDIFAKIQGESYTPLELWVCMGLGGGETQPAS